MLRNAVANPAQPPSDDPDGYAPFPLSRTLFIAGALELSLNRVIVETLRPPPGKTASALLITLDWAGLYLFYFATILAAFALWWRGLQRPRAIGMVSAMAVGTAGLAGIAALAMPASQLTAAGLRGMAGLALIAGIVEAWRLRMPRRLSLAITLWAMALLAPLGLALLQRHLGADATMRAGAHVIRALPLLGLLAPALLAPRPLRVTIKMAGPWLLAIMTAAVVYTSINEQPVASAQMFKTAFGIDMTEGTAASRLVAGSLAVAAFMWTLGACAISTVRANRDVSVGMALVMMGGLGLPWPLYTLLGLAGIWLMITAAPYVYEEPILQPHQAKARPPSIAMMVLMLALLMLGGALAGCGPTHTRPAREPSVTATQASTEARPTELTQPAAAPLAPWLPAPEIESLAKTAAAISDAALADATAWPALAYLTDRIGHRLSGSPQLATALTWAQATLEREGITVRLQPTKVRHWVRGAEHATMLAPIKQPLAIIGLGGTVPTPRRGITAPVVVVDSWDALAAAKDRVKGAIVLYNVPLDNDEHSYGKVFGYRYRGASKAAELGAAAVLVRSLTMRSLRTPHTGTLKYTDGVPKIPAAAISIEDAQHIARLAAAGQTVTVSLNLQSQDLPPAPSYNLIAEIKGREAPDEIVLIGAHIDSWDVGQGAHDDAGGVVACMQALATIKRLGLTPRRTIRAVLFTNEENGTAGADAYAAAEGPNAASHVLAFETDSGTFAPLGYFIEVSDAAAKRSVDASTIFARWATLAPALLPGGVSTATPGWAGTDVDPMLELGVLGASIHSANEAYFDYHHTEADTLDKISPIDFTNNIRAIAVMAYVVADASLRLDAP